MIVESRPISPELRALYGKLNRTARSGFRALLRSVPNVRAMGHIPSQTNGAERPSNEEVA